MPVRFTPTRVGTACALRTVSIAPRVHPHASGDSENRITNEGVGKGSPPREWGQRGRSTPTATT